MDSAMMCSAAVVPNANPSSQAANVQPKLPNKCEHQDSKYELRRVWSTGTVRDAPSEEEKKKILFPFLNNSSSPFKGLRSLVPANLGRLFDSHWVAATGKAFPAPERLTTCHDLNTLQYAAVLLSLSATQRCLCKRRVELAPGDDRIGDPMLTTVVGVAARRQISHSSQSPLKLQSVAAAGRDRPPQKDVCSSAIFSGEGLAVPPHLPCNVFPTNWRNGFCVLRMPEHNLTQVSKTPRIPSIIEIQY
ncbi:hypothetical protein BJX99DRAFT_184895 [Aspergillus californicus]